MPDRSASAPCPAAAPSKAAVLLGLLLSFGTAGLIHGMQPMPRDSDAAYHYAVALLVRAHGILHSFPWARFSIVRDEYSDKELLFHLFFLPWTPLGYVTTVKIVGVTLGGLWLFTIFWILAREGVRRAWLWPVLSVASSGYFVVRFGLCRPHLLAVPMTIAIVWLATRRRYRWLLCLALIYPLAYHAFHALWVALVLVEGVRWLSTGRPEWRTAAVLAVGNTIGLLLHPNFPAVLEHSWLETFQTLFASAVLGEQVPGVGAEFAAFSPGDLVVHTALPFAATAAALVHGWRQRRADPLPLVFGVLALAFGVLTVASQRFVEYQVPLATMALALALPTTRLLPGVALIVGLALQALFNQPNIRRMLREVELFPPQVVAELRPLVPEGAHVFHCDWGSAGYIWIALPERELLYALNPVRFYRHDPEGYAIFWDLVHNGSQAPAELVRERFDSRYVLCDIRSDYHPFIASLMADPDATYLKRSGYWHLFDVGAPPSQREAGGRW